MNKTPPQLPGADHAQAFGHAVGEIWKSMQGLSMPLPALNALRADYIKEATAMWNGAVERLSDDKGRGAPLADRRFAANAVSYTHLTLPTKRIV